MNHHVYRSGPIALAVHRPTITALYAYADTLRPAGRPGRTTALFCSPTLLGASRWLRANLLCAEHGADVSVRDLAVSPDPSIYAYPVTAWDRASHGLSTEADMRAFWAAGVPLAAWFTRAATEGLDAREWEVLVPLSAVAGVRPVADERVVASIPADDWTRAALTHDLWLAHHTGRR